MVFHQQVRRANEKPSLRQVYVVLSLFVMEISIRSNFVMSGTGVLREQFIRFEAEPANRTPEQYLAPRH